MCQNLVCQVKLANRIKYPQLYLNIVIYHINSALKYKRYNFVGSVKFNIY